MVGFFGKLPSHGDFVGRRLPPDVRDCFDRWLQAGLVRSKEDLGEEWLPVWLGSPLWRFVVAAGVCGEQAWAGVMMPSHDRVGRCFPLLLMAGMAGTPSLQDCLTVHDGWFARLEELALSTLEDNFSLDSLDAALRELSLPSCAAASDETVQSAWWTDGSARVAARVSTFPGFPPVTAFAAMIDDRFNVVHAWSGS